MIPSPFHFSFCRRTAAAHAACCHLLPILAPCACNASTTTPPRPIRNACTTAGGRRCQEAGVAGEAGEAVA
ncbi:hypothetical protein GQ55_5G310400 [Panicum hallii var. hallii]|uniref:Bifunctional inhibitor/plant lipid transfer protein/seed storage helical domain-containing protein n=1 Tax=Panicum hallii var. hallii TaxID=1504633 RepID=A0A2T7DLN0_9POAL|nr:hypothetical protein GQ55_5G310400 [Panicum hallii var. hallii]